MTRTSPIEAPAAPLSDGIVALRRRRPADLDAIAAASHDPLTRRWLNDAPMDETARATSLDRVEQAWLSGQAAPLTIADADTDEAIGMVNLQFRDDEVATVAYSVFPARRGQGVAPRAVHLVAHWALTDLGVTQLLLEADEGNAASIRVAEKCRFQPSGRRTEQDPDGEPRTTLVFARTAP
ncbi:MAG: GNAT family protein [Actinocatenispora sp.]